MLTIEFLKPRLVGPRFDDHSIPLEFLRDLAALEELVTETAKEHFRAANPARRRVTRGFALGTRLALSGIRDGSVMPVISLVMEHEAEQLIPSAVQEQFLAAREDIVAAIASAEAEEPVAKLTPILLRYFDRIGRSLHAGEAMVFERPQLPPARLTPQSRIHLVKASNIGGFTQEWSGRGTVPEADKSRKTFTLEMPDGSRIPAPMAPEFREVILDSFDNYAESGDNLRVWVQGIAKFNHKEQMVSLESIEQVSSLDANDVEARIDELLEIREGWLDGGGEALDPNGAHWLAAEMLKHLPDDLPLPYLYPTPDGGIQAERSLGSESITLEIDLLRHAGLWHSLNLETSVAASVELNLDESDTWELIVGQLEEFAREVE